MDNIPIAHLITAIVCAFSLGIAAGSLVVNHIVDFLGKRRKKRLEDLTVQSVNRSVRHFAEFARPNKKRCPIEDPTQGIRCFRPEGHQGQHQYPSFVLIMNNAEIAQDMHAVDLVFENPEDTMFYLRQLRKSEK